MFWVNCSKASTCFLESSYSNKDLNYFYEVIKLVGLDGAGTSYRKVKAY